MDFFWTSFVCVVFHKFDCHKNWDNCRGFVFIEPRPYIILCDCWPSLAIHRFQGKSPSTISECVCDFGVLQQLDSNRHRNPFRRAHVFDEDLQVAH